MLTHLYQRVKMDKSNIVNDIANDIVNGVFVFNLPIAHYLDTLQLTLPSFPVLLPTAPFPRLFFPSERTKEKAPTGKAHKRRVLAITIAKLSYLRETGPQYQYIVDIPQASTPS